jgi:hypothetical protein
MKRTAIPMTTSTGSGTSARKANVRSTPETPLRNMARMALPTSHK